MATDQPASDLDNLSMNDDHGDTVVHGQTPWGSHTAGSSVNKGE